MTKYITGLMSVSFSIFLFIVTGVTSIDIAVYGNMDYYEKEYEKYNVNDPCGIVNMNMDELMKVTRGMLSYLKGGRDNLNIEAEIDGETKEFFNKYEKAHLAEVKSMFMAGLEARIFSAIMMVLIIIAMLCSINKKQILPVILKAYGIFQIVFFVLMAGIGIFAVTNFTGLFNRFHRIFFSNGNWSFDPSVSRMINILPEGFFIDTSIRIVVIFILIIVSIDIVLSVVNKYIKKIGGTYEQG